jgi:hypothetical protein
MSNLRLVSIVILLCVAGLGAAACGSSSTSSTTASGIPSTKAAFCDANVTIDKAAANTITAVGFLAVLKANQASLDVMEKNAPAGQLRTDAREFVEAARAAITSNNANGLNNNSVNINSAKLDTYCGVDGNGDPLPAYFAAGKGSAFCSTSGAISAGVNPAVDAAGVLAFLAAHQNLLDQYASDISRLPSSVRADAQILVTTARAAIASNNATNLGTPEVSQASMQVELYCGTNR